MAKPAVKYKLDYYSDLTDLSSDDDATKRKASSSNKPKKKKTKKIDFKTVLEPTAHKSVSVEWCYKMVKKNRINLNPQYQRGVVWSEDKQSGLIDSIMHHFPISQLIFADLGPDNKICIDGKQRLTSIVKFMEGDLSYKDSHLGRKMWYQSNDVQGRKCYDETMKDDFKLRQINIVEMKNLTDAQQREIFQRVQHGQPLGRPERLQGTRTPRAYLAVTIRERIERYSESNLGKGQGGDKSFTNLFAVDSSTAKAKIFVSVSQILYLISKSIAQNLIVDANGDPHSSVTTGVSKPSSGKRGRLARKVAVKDKPLSEPTLDTLEQWITEERKLSAKMEVDEQDWRVGSWQEVEAENKRKAKKKGKQPEASEAEQNEHEEDEDDENWRKVGWRFINIAERVFDILEMIFSDGDLKWRVLNPEPLPEPEAGTSTGKGKKSAAPRKSTRSSKRKRRMSIGEGSEEKYIDPLELVMCAWFICLHSQNLPLPLLATALGKVRAEVQQILLFAESSVSCAFPKDGFGKMRQVVKKGWTVDELGGYSGLSSRKSAYETWTDRDNSVEGLGIRKAWMDRRTHAEAKEEENEEEDSEEEEDELDSDSEEETVVAPREAEGMKKRKRDETDSEGSGDEHDRPEPRRRQRKRPDSPKPASSATQNKPTSTYNGKGKERAEQDAPAVNDYEAQRKRRTSLQQQHQAGPSSAQTAVSKAPSRGQGGPSSKSRSSSAGSSTRKASVNKNDDDMDVDNADSDDSSLVNVKVPPQFLVPSMAGPPSVTPQTRRIVSGSGNAGATRKKTSPAKTSRSISANGVDSGGGPSMPTPSRVAGSKRKLQEPMPDAATELLPKMQNFHVSPPPRGHGPSPESSLLFSTAPVPPHPPSRPSSSSAVVPTSAPPSRSASAGSGPMAQPLLTNPSLTRIPGVFEAAEKIKAMRASENTSTPTTSPGERLIGLPPLKKPVSSSSASAPPSQITSPSNAAFSPSSLQGQPVPLPMPGPSSSEIAAQLVKDFSKPGGGMRSASNSPQILVPGNTASNITKTAGQWQPQQASLPARPQFPQGQGPTSSGIPQQPRRASMDEQVQPQPQPPASLQITTSLDPRRNANSSRQPYASSPLSSTTPMSAAHPDRLPSGPNSNVPPRSRQRAMVSSDSQPRLPQTRGPSQGQVTPSPLSTASNRSHPYHRLSDGSQGPGQFPVKRARSDGGVFVHEQQQHEVERRVAQPSESLKGVGRRGLPIQPRGRGRGRGLSGGRGRGGR